MFYSSANNEKKKKEGRKIGFWYEKNMKHNFQKNRSMKIYTYKVNFHTQMFIASNWTVRTILKRIFIGYIFAARKLLTPCKIKNLPFPLTVKYRDRSLFFKWISLSRAETDEYGSRSIFIFFFLHTCISRLFLFFFFFLRTFWTFFFNVYILGLYFN